ncbi:MAG: chemotaxis protein CheW [Pacificimonas sp.]
MDELLQDFLEETNEALAAVDVELVRFEREPENADALAHIFRLVHTVKGSCGFIGLPRLEALAHAAETLLDRLREGALKPTAAIVTETLAAVDAIRVITTALANDGSEPVGDDSALITRLEQLSDGQEPVSLSAPESADIQAAPEAGSVRVAVELLDELMSGVSELVLTRNQILNERRAGTDTLHQRLSTQVGQLQDAVVRMRMQPIDGAWRMLPRLVRQLSVDLEKPLDLVMSGGETELDRQMLAALRDPLAHMVRNAADHGIESQAERASAGKPATGRITLAASQEGGHIIVTLSDDGCGLDLQSLREKAVATGVMSRREARTASETRLGQLVFAPGLTTATEITPVSGRGVGMDVVRANLESVGGSIDISSQAGVGTTFTLRLPLTLAIMPALLVGCAGQRFAVPQVAVAELVSIGSESQHELEMLGDTLALRLRERTVPVLDLRQRFALTGDDEARHVLVMRGRGAKWGLVVDEVFDTEELVVKPVSPAVAATDVYAGQAVLGDGRSILILDAQALGTDIVEFDAVAAITDNDVGTMQTATDPIMLFRADGDPRPRAVPVNLVARIEDITPERIERAGDGFVVQLQGKLVPLIGLARDADLSRSTAALLFVDGEAAIALAVDAVNDIVEADVRLDIGSDEECRLGTAVIEGRATELIDVGALFSRAVPGASTMVTEADSQPRLLVVDDSSFFRNMLTPLLSAAGYRVTAVPSVDEALELRNSGSRFDLILSDIEMPEKTGLDFARAVREGGAWTATPLVALSSKADEADMDVGMAAGFDRYVAKFDRQRLLGLIDTSLRLREGKAA